ncbi:hypothetical protein BDV95DRAFT_587012 [Massariosphaeria phaeospora]|uniref:Uncharacterized protein n=1 Tax=Massariosphaeria phaeospora TaxID=100035 RepID=A0A7C8M1P7_9PLEO|nr:hypothetical protein BDV95DRAFT_587012 [Massariosphaeria phaeospora]
MRRVSLMCTRRSEGRLMLTPGRIANMVGHVLVRISVLVVFVPALVKLVEILFRNRDSVVEIKSGRIPAEQLASTGMGMGMGIATLTTIIIRIVEVEVRA